MKWNKIFSVYRKEIRETLRDRRTIISMILVPVLMYPLLFVLMGQIMTAGIAKLKEEKSSITVKPGVADRLIDLISSRDRFEVVDSEDPEEDLRAGEIDAFVEFESVSGGDSLKVYFDAAVERSEMARGRLEDVLAEYRTERQETALRDQNIGVALLYPFGVGYVNIASASRMGGRLLGIIVPILLVVVLGLGAMYPAIDLTAGEKERGTLETIMTVPVARVELLTGKFLTVSTIALITGVLNLVSMFATYSLGFVSLGPLSEKLSFGLSPAVAVVLLIMLVPLALFISAAMLSVCLFTRSFKDAQNLVTPFFLVLMLPGFFAMTPGIELGEGLALVPILNICLLFKELLLDHFQYNLIFLVFLSNAVFALLSIVVVSRLFNEERILFDEGRGLRFSLDRSTLEPRDCLDPSEAMLLFAVLVLLLFYLGTLFQVKLPVYWGVLLTEWTLILAPVLLFLWFGRVRFRTALHLNGFHPLALLGTLLLGLGGLHLCVWLAHLQADLFPESVEIGRVLEKLLDFREQKLSPAVALFAFALSPAICEEALFRGALLSSLRDRLNGAAVVLIIALLFGAFHMHLFRLLPTAFLGVLLTFVTYRTGSIYLAVIAHALNNGIALVIISYPEAVRFLPWLEDEGGPSLPVVGVMMLFTLVGVFLIGLPQKRELRAE